MKFVLVHGAADQAASWDDVAAALRGRGHDVVAVDLPCEDDDAGFEQYADTVVEAIGSDSDHVAVVGHSLGGYTATLVADRVSAELLVLVTAMVPRPGETPMEFWADTGHRFGTDDEIETYLPDATPEQAERALALGRDQSGTPMSEPFPLEAWPEVPTRYLACTRDNFNPVAWTRAMVRDRLGIEADEIDAGHCPYITRPGELAERLHDYAAT
ncbi:MAG TPA: alpha/beta hydrolase [Thermoleophilaceae bacterium]|nr:alpha/beta hydrolase [Thermoleophilaceae bacterium]